MAILIIRSASGESSPLDLPLVQESDNIFTRLGEFDYGGDDDFANGGGGMCVGNGGLYMAGLRTEANIGRISIPALGGSATTQLSPVALTGGTWASQEIVSGSLFYGGELYVNRSVDYDAHETIRQIEWIQKATAEMGSQTAPCTMNASNGAYVRRLSGPMGHVPAIWQALLGGPAFTSGGRLSINRRAQMGYGFGTFDPADVTSGGAVSVNVLLDYDDTNPLEPDSAMPEYAAWPKNASGGTDLYSESNADLGCALIPKGSRSLLFLTCHGFGVADNGCRPGSSVHNDPNRIQVVAYDLAEILDAVNTYDPQPYAWWELADWDVPWGACVGAAGAGSAPGNFCYDPDNDRLYSLADGSGGFPSYSPIQVWSVGSL